MLKLNMPRLEPKTSFYNSNGTGILITSVVILLGRDTYISNDSGGIIRARQFSFKIGSGMLRNISLSIKKIQGPSLHIVESIPELKEKLCIIIQMVLEETITLCKIGSSFITYRIDEGGFARTARHSERKTFWGSLRSYERIKVPPINANPDYFGWAQTYSIRSSKDYETERTKRETVRNMVDRLSKPRVPKFKSVDFRILTTKGSRYKLNF